MLLLNITLFTFNINTTITIIHNCHKKMVAIILLLRPLLQLHLLYPQYKPLGSGLLVHLCSLEQVLHGRQPAKMCQPNKSLENARREKLACACYSPEKSLHLHFQISA